MTGIPEAQIESIGHLYDADADSLARLLAEAPASKEAYCAWNVRAKIAMPTGEVYYIDAGGVARVGSRVVRIDTTAFERLVHLDPAGGCPKDQCGR
ncbi:MAG: hypothetical protein J7598_13130 [Mitsuaria chitosanitabida]|uniref:hypothetical protein n=1 Tax=Roseateles chitosanitabidus TaxID=65048 RepID=UPI001B1E917D|nr:hypothetical protein [Roseateles chitosanitabidus]MBO9687544.1 hypothetical protein [Roseateles chitosanitabidus]